MMKRHSQSLYEVISDALNGWSRHKSLRLGASVAFYTMFSITPLFLIALALAGLLFGEQAARKQLFDQLSGLVGPASGEALQAIIASARRPAAGWWATAIALVTLFVGATGVFVELQDALNTIWEVQRKPGAGIRHFVKDRLLSFAMVLAIGFLLLVSLIISAVLAAMGHFFNGMVSTGPIVGQVFNFLLSLALITLLFAMIFKILPDVKVSWRNTWLGAAFSALAFNFGKFVLGYYLARSSVSSSYGAAGSLVILLMWVYYSSQTLFLGAEFTRAYAKHSGERVRPSAGAEFVTVKQVKAGTVAA